MKINDLKEKEIMHIDTSSKFYENKDTGIAYLLIKSQRHKGLGLSLRLKRELDRDLNISSDYAKLYSICIYYLIRTDLDLFDILVICGDENYTRVRLYLKFLFETDSIYFKKDIISLDDLRAITGDPKLKSSANGVANSYRKRALKSKFRQQKGRQLNIIKVNYNSILEKWKELDKKTKI